MIIYSIRASFTSERRAAMSARMMGHAVSEETRRKISDRKKRKQHEHDLSSEQTATC